MRKKLTDLERMDKQMTDEIERRRRQADNEIRAGDIEEKADSCDELDNGMDFTFATTFGKLPGFETEESCSLCQVALGKIHLRRKHRCRICSRRVCGACSESSLRLSSGQPRQRACNECIEVAWKSYSIQARACKLRDHLQIIAKINPEQCTEHAQDLEGAVSFCEQTIRPLQEMSENLVVVQAIIDGADESILEMPHIIVDLDRKLSDEFQRVASFESRSGKVEELSLPSEHWEPDTDTCSLCQAVFGLSQLKSRHHCRSCGKCICGACSSNFAKLHDQMLRVCTGCAVDAQKVQILSPRILKLHVQLFECAGLTSDVKVANASDVLALLDACAEVSYSLELKHHKLDHLQEVARQIKVEEQRRGQKMAS